MPATFSPHTRGCSPQSPWTKHRGRVFPAYAGMFLRPCVDQHWNNCFPRIRGDVPFPQMVYPDPKVFSPHTRGCSSVPLPWVVCSVVFPAYAGMFPSRWTFGLGASAFSPHTRGCSYVTVMVLLVRYVFPAYAGMFRGGADAWPKVDGFPRIRGDVPQTGENVNTRVEFSPHTRGCSVGVYDWGIAGFVFPAYAGMFLSLPGPVEMRLCFPRIRGDVPHADKRRQQRFRFSPHTRGCSGD